MPLHRTAPEIPPCVVQLLLDFWQAWNSGKASRSSPLLGAGAHSTRAGCSQSCPAWPGCSRGS